MPRILLDLRLLTPELTGVGRYLNALASGLPAQLPCGTDLVGLRSPGQPPIESVRTRTLIGPARLVAPLSLGQQLSLARQVNGVDHDLFHYPYFDLPFGLRGPLITTCYDLEPIRHPELFSRRIVWYYGLLARRLRTSSLVIAISENSARDAVELARVDEKRIRVVPLGVGPEFQRVREPARLEDVRRRLALPDRFILYVGNTMPHKNLPRLVRAMRDVHARHPEVILILAGAEDRHRSALQTLVAAENLGGAVRFVGRVADADLPALMSSAELFAYPSLYEGFGLPVLEAMACGTPVVTSAVSSLPEVVADGGVLVDPHDARMLSEALLRLLENPAEARRLAESGAVRARRFSWHECVMQHVSIYTTVLGL